MTDFFDNLLRILDESFKSAVDSQSDPIERPTHLESTEAGANPHAANFADHTVLHPIGLFALVALGVALLCVRRRNAGWPLLIMACFIPTAQRVVVAGADFDLLRIMIIFGTLRVLMRGEYSSIRWTMLDTVVIVWAIAGTLIPLLRAGPENVMYRMGQFYDALGMYFLFRCLLQDWSDFTGCIRALMCLSVPIAGFIFVEWSTGQNLFSMFGGVPLMTEIRDGKLRCQGAFSHPILTGCFWAAALPLMASQWFYGKRILTVVSGCAALFIIFACASATPLVGTMSAIMGVLLYYIRKQFRLIRWGLVVCLVGLQLVMKGPVWNLILKTSGLGGSTWHRFSLVDGAFRHMDEWWLIGSSVGSAHWGHWTFDVTNFYIAQALNGGIPLLGLFFLVFWAAFRQISTFLPQADLSFANRFFVWSIGVSIFVHAVNFFGVSYFGQIWIGWYVVLGMAGSIYAMARQKADVLNYNHSLVPRPMRAATANVAYAVRTTS